ncbi:MAG: JDVT-CTERM domain-containing protein, partial [Gammaproteobacteria bacterium]
DTDGDGIDDATEGDGDADDDGLRDFEDADDNEGNILQIHLGSKARLETQAGLLLKQGRKAFELNRKGGELNLSDVAADSLSHIGKLYDFIIDGLPHKGDTATLVIPLAQPVPSDPVYRVLMTTGWQNFIEDANNHLKTAKGAPGNCPPPGDAAFTAGLTPGDHCLEITIEDGGQNDEDGQADGRITDPSGVATNPPASTSTPATGGGGGGCAINPNAEFDPSLWVMLFLAMGYLYRRQYLRKGF